MTTLLLLYYVDAWKQLNDCAGNTENNLKMWLLCYFCFTVSVDNIQSSFKDTSRWGVKKAAVSTVTYNKYIITDLDTDTFRFSYHIYIKDLQVTASVFIYISHSIHTIHVSHHCLGSMNMCCILFTVKIMKLKKRAKQHTWWLVTENRAPSLLKSQEVMSSLIMTSQFCMTSQWKHVIKGHDITVVYKSLKDKPPEKQHLLKNSFLSQTKISSPALLWGDRVDEEILENESEGFYTFPFKSGKEESSEEAANRPEAVTPSSENAQSQVSAVSKTPNRKYPVVKRAVRGLCCSCDSSLRGCPACAESSPGLCSSTQQEEVYRLRKLSHSLCGLHSEGMDSLQGLCCQHQLWLREV